MRPYIQIVFFNSWLQFSYHTSNNCCVMQISETIPQIICRESGDYTPAEFRRQHDYNPPSIPANVLANHLKGCKGRAGCSCTSSLTVQDLCCQCNILIIGLDITLSAVLWKGRTCLTQNVLCIFIILALDNTKSYLTLALPTYKS